MPTPTYRVDLLVTMFAGDTDLVPEGRVRVIDPDDVARGAALIAPIEPDILYPNDDDEAFREDYTEWRRVFLEAARGSEALLWGN